MTGMQLSLKRLALGIVGAVALTAPIGNGTAEAGQCGPRDVVVAHITGNVKADRRALALAGETNMVEIFVAENGTWVMTITRPNKATCVMAAGSSWESMPIKLAEGPAV